ncbi:hypothetical protein ACFXTH_035119 [Malus domestica]
MMAMLVLGFAPFGPMLLVAWLGLLLLAARLWPGLGTAVIVATTTDAGDSGHPASELIHEKRLHETNVGATLWFPLMGGKPGT